MTGPEGEDCGAVDGEASVAAQRVLARRLVHADLLAGLDGLGARPLPGARLEQFDEPRVLVGGRHDALAPVFAEPRRAVRLPRR